MKDYLIKKGEHRSIQTEIKKGQRLSPKTEFKKGITPHNKKPIGYITIRRDKTKNKDRKGTERRYIKIGHDCYDWKVYATWLWESKKGKIPQGMFVHHIDGNSLNDKLSNYKLVDRSKHAILHKISLIKARKKYEFNKQKQC
jgi:hypothetical protein